MKYLEISPGKETTLPAHGELPKQVHVFDQDSIEAVNAAIAARRPLLIRGEPGVGKSQLARAVAKELRRALVQYVVDAHCESRDLLWNFDAIQRLADAQLGNALGDNRAEIKETLRTNNYLHPGPLWWALDWQSAETQAEKVKQSAPYQYEGCDPDKGCVVLIDEIDKAEMDLPNGLLEVLGEARFTPMGWDEPISASKIHPLVIITTNEERALPNAFLRRCLVLYMDLFERNDPKPLLIRRGKAHFPKLNKDVLEKAADMLMNDRAAAEEKQLQPLPGQAEYLDLLRAVDALSRENKESPLDLINTVAKYILNKQAGATL